MKKKYTHILWDWNGTLLDDMWLCVDVINVLLKKYNKPVLSLIDYQKHFDFPVKDYYERIGFDFKQTPFEIVGTEFINGYYKRWQECKLHKDVEFVSTNPPIKLGTISPIKVIKMDSISITNGTAISNAPKV